MIITIDGPAGSGKSTVARMLAARLGAAYLDSGAMYRALTLAALRGGVDLDSESALAVLSGQVTIDLETGPDQAAVLLDGEDVSREIRSAEVSEKASYLAASPAVRTYMVVAQRRLGNDLGSVATGQLFHDQILELACNCSAGIYAPIACLQQQQLLVYHGIEVILGGFPALLLTAQFGG